MLHRHRLNLTILSLLTAPITCADDVGTTSATESSSTGTSTGDGSTTNNPTGATPIPGEMFRQSQEGLITTLERIRTQMLDDFGLKSTEKIDNAALKKLKTLLNDKKGRVTEAVAMSDKVGKHWRDFALLPYGETKNIDLALSYIFPYQFWYSRSYATG